MVELLVVERTYRYVLCYIQQTKMLSDQRIFPHFSLSKMYSYLFSDGLFFYFNNYYKGKINGFMKLNIILGVI